MFELIGGIVLEGLKVFGEERRTRIMDKYSGLITALRQAENAGFKTYTDADIDIIDEKIYDFLTAYKKELVEFNNEKN